MRERTYYVYILASSSKVLYTGVTGNLDRRFWEHKRKLRPGFSARYNTTRLVYLEAFQDIRAAIAREKQIKAWRRSKKTTLISTLNPNWIDLGSR